MSDGLYGLTPDPADDFGINLGALAPRGERNVLIASLDALLRVASNPFFPYMISRIEEGIDDQTPPAKVTAASVSAPAPGADDQASGWSFNDIVTLILNLGRDRSDPESVPP